MKKTDMTKANVRELCDVLEQESGYYYGCEQFQMYKLLEHMTTSDIGLPSTEAVRNMCRYAKDHYPKLELHNILDYAVMILTGEIELTDTQPETEAAIDTMVEYITCNTGYSFEEVLNMIKEGIA